MARITHVKHAQQRYEMVPVLNEDGSTKVKGVTNKDGSPKLTKRGREIVQRKTQKDKTKPLPPENCGKCNKPIEVGSPYKWIAPRSGPYGGRRLVRCGECPSWHVWEYSSSLSARVAEVAFNFEEGMIDVDNPDTVSELLGNAAEAVREIAGEKEESAGNIVDGFGHETSQSEELTQVAEELNSWADEIDNVDVPSLPETEEMECEECGGEGVITVKFEHGEQQQDCEDCDGLGKYTPDDPTDEQMDEWRSEVEDACSIVNECPV